MQQRHDKVRANVLDYTQELKPESPRKRWLFNLAIGVFVILFAAYLSYWMDNYEAYRLMNSMKPLTHKSGAAFAYLFTPLTIILAIIGLYQRTNYGYWFTGLYAGVLLFLLSSFLFGVITYAGTKIFSVPVVILTEFGLPLLLGSYLLFFLSRRQVMNRCGVKRPALFYSGLCGYVLGAGIFTLLWM